MPKLTPVLLLGLSAWCAAVPAHEFTQCYDFGCKSTQSFSLSEVQWRQISALFDRELVNDAASEKQAIRSAIALMEQYSGEITGTHLDKGGNYPGSDIAMQMDCIDESTNTWQYLGGLQRRGLLHWHQVEERAHRIVWFLDHWTAVISERNSQRRFAVDSWYRDNGELPLLQDLDDWRRKRDFPASLNPELSEAS